MVEQVIVEKEIEGIEIVAYVDVDVCAGDDSFDHEFGTERVEYTFYDIETACGEVIAYDEDGEERSYVPVSAWEDVLAEVSEREPSVSVHQLTESI